MIEKNILVIIPARGGSKGIPRKNIRSLASKPLIYYSINTSLSSKYKPDVYVSSDDEEILSISEKLGAKTIYRSKKLAGDKITLDSVIFDAYTQVKSIEHKTYDYIITLQPTSPLLTSESLDKAIERTISNPKIETTISANDDTHLTWLKEADKYIPNYKARLNRQYLPAVYKETGGFFITRADIMSPENRIGKEVDLFLLNNGEEIDIDTYEDWNLCEYHLKRRTILFVVTGRKDIGLGHVFRSLQIANDILNHRLIFLLEKGSELGFGIIKNKHYEVYIQKHENLTDDIKKIKPDIVINDILDTNEAYMLELKKTDIKTINFEDIGIGSRSANLVFNALYPDKFIDADYYFGHEYFMARDEFLLSSKKQIEEKVSQVLITFGGTDPNNYTLKILDSIYEYCQNKQINIEVILGLGYTEKASLSKFKNVNILQDVKNISDYMLKADIIFSSAGRTVYEIACIGTPSIILSQNERENTHLFAREENGFVNLGLAINYANDKLLKQFIQLSNDVELRKQKSALMLSRDVKKGRKRVIRIINDFINNI